MTKLLNIALMRQDFYHVIRRSSAVLQFCGSAVMRSNFCRRHPFVKTSKIKLQTSNQFIGNKILFLALV